jgi:tetratricopeptide (TPR) repeat protein
MTRDFRSSRRRGGEGRRSPGRSGGQSAAIWELALESHRAGDLERAKQLYARHLEKRPSDAAALHLLGFAEFQSLRFDRAIELIQSAVQLRPEEAEYHNNLALACLADCQLDPARQHAADARRLGHRDGHGYWHVGMTFCARRDWTHAEAAVQLALEMDPESAEAHNCLGVVYAAQRRFEAAEKCYRRALELNPSLVEAWNNLGNAYRDQQRLEESLPFYQRALNASPSFAAAHNNRGVALAELGRIDEALACHQRAVQLQPAFAEAVNNLGNDYRDLGDHHKAIDCYRRALALQPGSPEILSNLGVALRRGGQAKVAIGYFRRAVVLQPNSVRILHHLGCALGDIGQVQDAEACFQHLARLEPNAPLWKLQSALWCPAVFVDRDEMNSYWNRLRYKIAAAAGSDFACHLADVANILAAPPFNLQYFDGCLLGMKQAYASVFAERLGKAYHSRWVPSWSGPSRRPRVGFIVTEGHEGLFRKSMQGVISRLRDFQVIVFCARGDAPPLRAAFAGSDLQVAPFPHRFDQIVRTIDDARCDLLYYWEIGTDVVNYFLPFLRLAPRQVTSWGVQVTSGIPGVDYYLSSRFVEPPDAQRHYSERLVLADSLLSYRDRLASPRPASRDAFPLPASAHWYVCAQQLGKFHIDFDALLAAILRRDPLGMVVGIQDPFGTSASRLRERWRQSIPDVADRIHLLPRMDAAAYLSLLQQADVLLEPPHFGGVNSAYDAFSLGKPIVVLPSAFHRGRYALGCYERMNCPDCVASSAEEYVDCAVRLASDGKYRGVLEARILDASECLFADLAAVREHERFFLELLETR